MIIAAELNQELVYNVIQDCKNNPNLYCIIACKTNQQLRELIKKMPSNSHKMTTLAECKFENGSFLTIISSRCMRGRKANKIYYDKDEDEEIINCFIRPCSQIMYAK